MHRQREAEQAAGISVLPDDMTRVQVEGEHQAGLQDEERAGEKCSEGEQRSRVQQHLGAVQMFLLL